MSLDRRLSCAFVCFSLSLSSARAASPLETNTSWLDHFLRFSLFDFFNPTTTNPVTLQDLLAPPRPACGIEPIPALQDEQAQEFEAAAGTSAVIDITGLTPATALALLRFEHRVASLGGKIALTSAFRPVAYQEHLQAVWDKWKQLRENYEEGCAVVKSEVAAEFERHELMESQRPVPFSDHTRGIGFDANVFFPARHYRNIDRVALASGVRRPDVVHDPVHFRLVARSAARR